MWVAIRIYINPFHIIMLIIKNMYNVNDQYEYENLNDNLGNTFELYYNKNNPNQVSKKENPINFLLLIGAIFFTALAFPFVFFKKNMEKRMDKNLAAQEKQEWKI